MSLRSPTALQLGALGALGALAMTAACAQILGFDKGYSETGGGATSSSSASGTTHASASSAATTGAGGVGTGAGGMAPAGPPVPCKVDTDCTGLDTECAKYACKGMICVATDAPSGTAISAQTVGNCQKIVCDGHGGLSLVTDDANVPDNNNPCAKALCTGGKPSNPPEPAGTKCGASLACDGMGHCAGCSSPGDCPGMDTDCQSRSCTNSLCGFIYTAAGTAVKAQTPGDCKENVCNGMGAVSVIFDATDVPTSANPCVVPGCSMGSPTQTNTAAGAACTAGADGGATVCDGDGHCVECLVATSCPGMDTDCQKRTCTAGVCGFSDTASGTATSTQTPGDCQQNVCDGMGGVTSVADDTDTPTDGSVCDTASCTAGQPVLTPVAQGTTCGTMKSCDGKGSCVGCTTASQCPGTSTDCQTVVCAAGGVCGFSYAASGTATSTQTAGDCKQNVCNGMGSVTSVADDTDVPTTTNQCLGAVCTNGVPSNPPKAAGTACTSTGTVCNGAGLCGVCVPGATRLCCGVISEACCESEEAHVHVCDPEIETCGPGLLLPGCCCESTDACNASGQWAACL